MPDPSRPWLEPVLAPFKAKAFHCGGYRPHLTLSPAPCSLDPIWTGLVYHRFPIPGVASVAFTCDQHRIALTAPRRLNDADRAELARRRALHESGLNGEFWAPDPPFATGPEARALMHAAHRWSVEHNGSGEGFEWTTAQQRHQRP